MTVNQRGVLRGDIVDPMKMSRDSDCFSADQVVLIQCFKYTNF